MSADSGVKVEKSIVIDKKPEQLFAFWRNFENLPKVMSYLQDVKVIDSKRSHWVAKSLGITREWDADVVNETPNEMIAWRSIEGSDVDTSGSVHFIPVNGGSSTEVKVSLKYDPPGGKVGAAIAHFFGNAPEQQIEADLKKFKETMESSTVAGK